MNVLYIIVGLITLALLFIWYLHWLNRSGSDEHL